ncbi:hypothetical protein GALL_386560 [mine drainage metagenome]|uniref:Uncharacterized protein n=1 Tax=mine drainage metagenome TaxID=410659 RepID=A0A1J5Q8T3_9ZZZZ
MPLVSASWTARSATTTRSALTVPMNDATTATSAAVGIDAPGIDGPDDPEETSSGTVDGSSRAICRATSPARSAATLSVGFISDSPRR